MILKDKTILITGIGKGIGESVCKIALKEGAFVYGITRSKEDLKKFKNEKKSIAELESSISDNEIATKLDLARAYVDMGEPDGAYEILDEVISKGNKSQQLLAKKLLKSIDS